MCNLATAKRSSCFDFVILWVLPFAIIDAVSAAEGPPNFVLILTDDQGYGDLGCYGSKQIATPHIDRLAETGVRLTSFYAAAPICTPTRAALMTGCHAARVGLPTPLHVYDEIGLHPDEVTLPEALGELGYRTACIGKWHLGHTPPFYPTRHGFDVYFGTPLGHMFNRPPVGKAKGDTSDLFLDGEQRIPMPADADLTELLTDAAVGFIGKQTKRRPFFLYLAHTMPHEPLAVSQRFSGKSRGGLYGDVIECVDWSTGRVLAALEEHGHLTNTVVVFTSDNGPKKGHGSAGPLRGFKHEPYEGGVRVPCLVSAPGRLEGGRRIDAITTIMDLYPTFVRIAGGKVSPQQVRDGTDLWPLLTGKENAKPPHTEHFYFVRHGVLAGVRDSRWKLLKQRGNVELYDLANDIGETNDLAGEHPEIVERLAKRMRVMEADVRETRRQAGRSGE